MAPLTLAELKNSISERVKEVLGLETLDDNTDFFSVGLDSITLTLVHSHVCGLNCGAVDRDVIFKNPTVSELAEYLRRSREREEQQAEPSQPTLMESLFTKYSNLEYPTHVHVAEAATADPRGHSVVVTGATGSLGVHIVTQLIADPLVKKVYCLLRPNPNVGNQDPTERVIEATRLSLDERKGKIEGLMSDLSSPGLGLSSEKYNELRDKVSIVIHGAWAVNYNMRLRSFEYLILGAYNLMSLCLKSNRATPASFNFISSIAAAPAHLSVPETELPSSDGVSDMGYAQSKFVTERLCAAVVQKRPTMVARVLRLGQIVGDTIHGRWNRVEAIPMTVLSAIKTNCLPMPEHDEKVYWLPADKAAKVCIELSFATVADRMVVFNVSHPKPMSWNNVFLTGLEKGGMPFEKVSPAEWLVQLLDKDPSNRLLLFFQTKYAAEPIEETVIDTTKAKAYSPTLNGCEVVSEELVGKFWAVWKPRG